MSHFYASLKGSTKNSVTRRGHKTTGIQAHIRGWDIGVYIEISYNEDLKKDEVKIWKTKGSNDPTCTPLYHYTE